MYLRVSSPPTAFGGLFEKVSWPHIGILALGLLTNESVRYFEEFAMSLTLTKQNRESTEGHSKCIVQKNNDKFEKRISLNK